MVNDVKDQPQVNFSQQQPNYVEHIETGCVCRVIYSSSSVKTILKKMVVEDPGSADVNKGKEIALPNKLKGTTQPLLGWKEKVGENSF